MAGQEAPGAPRGMWSAIPSQGSAAVTAAVAGEEASVMIRRGFMRMKSGHFVAIPAYNAIRAVRI